MRALGIDLSIWDLRPLDWKQARAILSFAFIKVSQGLEEDPLFRAQWEAARGYVLRSPYHFFDPAKDPAASVDRTLSILRACTPGEIPIALDLEITSGRDDTLERARSWLEIYERATGERPIIYSSPGFLESIGAGAKTASGRYLNEWLRSYEVWLASWPYDLGLSDAERETRIHQVLTGEILIIHPTGVPPWLIRPGFHQWTSRAKPEDIPGYYMGAGHKLAVDLSFYYGTREDLLLRYGDLPAIPDNGGNMYKFSITPTRSDGSRVRSDHYVIDSPIPNRIGSLAAGRFAFGDEKWIAPQDGTNFRAGDTWLRVKLVDGVALDGWIAAIHNGAVYGSITDLQTEPDPGPVEGLEATVTLSSPGYVSQTVTIVLPPES